MWALTNPRKDGAWVCTTTRNAVFLFVIFVTKIFTGPIDLPNIEVPTNISLVELVHISMKLPNHFPPLPLQVSFESLAVKKILLLTTFTNCMSVTRNGVKNNSTSAIWILNSHAAVLPSRHQIFLHHETVTASQCLPCRRLPSEKPSEKSRRSRERKWSYTCRQLQIHFFLNSRF